jgi:hypothetical protein
MFRDIPQSRLQLYIIIIGLLPCFVVLSTTLSRQQTLSEYRQQVAFIQDKGLTKQNKQALNRRVRASISDADHFYIDKHLETLVFLQPEIQMLEKAAEATGIADNQAVKQRLEYLKSENRIQFTEAAVQTFDGIQEVGETLIQPVEINLFDLQKLLVNIEGRTIAGLEPPAGRPQLIVLDCRIEKKIIIEGHETLSLFLKLLKREVQ